MAEAAKPADPKAAKPGTFDVEKGFIVPPAEEPADVKRIREWDWKKEPRDWTSVPANFTPEAYSPMVPALKEGETPSNIPGAQNTDGRRALASIKIKKASDALGAQPQTDPKYGPLGPKVIEAEKSGGKPKAA